MAIWKVPVEWTMTAVIEVIADSMEAAMEIARDADNVIPLPDPEDSYYLEESWSLACDDPQYVREMYNHRINDTDEEVEQNDH